MRILWSPAYSHTVQALAPPLQATGPDSILMPPPPSTNESSDYLLNFFFNVAVVSKVATKSEKLKTRSYN